MKLISITGGVACGKGAVRKELESQLSDEEVRHFDCDVCVGELLTDPKIVGRLEELSGSSLVGADNQLDRTKFRDLLFSNNDLRRNVESLLHPIVLAKAEEYSISVKSESVRALLIEVPLLFESNFSIKRDCVLVVGASRASQIDRIVSNRGIDVEIAQRIVMAQWPIQEKLDRADFAIWNDGDRDAVSDQVAILVQRFFN